MNRILIKGGTIYDGTGEKPFRGDVCIEKDRIIGIGPHLEGNFTEIINAEGLTVTPGFVDVHRHCDNAMLTDDDFGKIELCQGITTVLCGNCGMSLAPSADFSRSAMYRYLMPCLGKTDESLIFPSFGDYLEALQKRKLPLHAEAMVGTGAVRIAVKGFSEDNYTRRELELAKVLLKESLGQGACGVSSGIMYVPECFTTQEEWRSLWRQIRESCGLITCHIRNEGDGLLPAVKEMIDLSRATELAVNISHFKSVGKKNWGRDIYRAVELIEESGLDISVDFYPYDGGSTMLGSLLPPEIITSYGNRMYEGLDSQTGRDAVRISLASDTEHPGRKQAWDNMIDAIGYERILVSSVNVSEHRWMEGKTVAEIMESGQFEDEVDCICKLMETERGNVGIIVRSMAQKDVDFVAQLPFSSVISDSLYVKTDHPHPRLYGAFSRVIEDYVYRRKILVMEEAIHKMTGKPASRFGVKDRGFLKSGCFADINVFDPAEITAGANYENPCVLSGGMRYVFSEGRVRIRDGKYL